MSQNILEKIGLYAIQHLNKDHTHNLLDYAHAFGNCPWATTAVMTAVDRAGFQMLVSGSGRAETVRIEFDEPLTAPNQLRKKLVQLAYHAEGLLRPSDT